MTTVVTQTPEEYYHGKTCNFCTEQYQVDDNLVIFAGYVRCGCKKIPIHAGTVFEVHKECGAKIVSTTRCRCCSPGYQSKHAHSWYKECANGHRLPYDD